MLEAMEELEGLSFDEVAQGNHGHRMRRDGMNDMMQDPKKMKAITIDDMEQDEQGLQDDSKNEKKHRNEEDIDYIEMAELVIVVGRPNPPSGKLHE